ncbi:hypothetical protein GCM10010365_16780 [Streptomyces poonensis]|uniref:Chaplin domain-containing protein n=1 Tax=Streptomyces poonensis TaxID=68255 RepID=A0A918PCB4_9ACTN|nr:hypothetical protein GCM10010365_16780 [Streptomyces poonensis]
MSLGGGECVNLNDGFHALGATAHGTGTLAGNAAEAPVGGPLNPCGGTGPRWPARWDRHCRSP